MRCWSQTYCALHLGLSFKPLEKRFILDSFQPVSRIPFLPRTWRVLCTCPLQYLQVTSSSRVTRLFIPRTWWVLCTCPLQYLQVASRSSSTTRLFIPRTWWLLCTCPLQHLQVASRSSSTTRRCIPRTWRVLSAHPLQYFKMTILGSSSARPCIPWTWRILVPQPLQCLRTIILIFMPACVEDLHIPRTRWRLAKWPQRYIPATSRSSSARLCIPRTRWDLCPCPLENFHVAYASSLPACVQTPRTWGFCSRIHFSTWILPLVAASAHVIASQGHGGDLARSHFSTSR